MANESPKNDKKEDKKKRKELRRKKREEYQNRLAQIDENDPSKRNPIIIELVIQHLHRTIDVFQARWSTNQPLSNTIFLNTPLFWYKKHKWTHKDVKEFFKIVGAYKDNLDSELSVIWGIDESSKKRKKEKRKKLKEKHLRKESFASLLTLRHSSLRLMQERSMQFVRSDDPKAERASVKIWNLMAKNEDDELNHAKFNIAINDNNILVDPDMSVDLFYELIRTWEIIEKHREERKNNPHLKKNKKDQYKKSRERQPMSMKQIGGTSAYFQAPLQPQTPTTPDGDNDKNELGFSIVDLLTNNGSHNKTSKEEEKDPPQNEKIKYIKKRTINRQYIKRMLRHINKNIKREHQIANPKKLKKSKLLLVVFGKIFDAIQNGQAFDVQNDYISQALTGETLNNPSALLEILQTRTNEWKERLQVLEFIESNLEINENLASLFEEENFLHLIVGWTTQLYDERSNVTKVGAELFPSILTVLLSRMESPAIIFEEEHALLPTILESLFTLLKNKRAKALSEIAHDVLIETINILSTVAQDLDHSFYHRIMEFLYEKTKIENEKHEKVRAGCIAYSLFVIYGTQSTEQGDEKEKEKNGKNGKDNKLNVNSKLNPLTLSASISYESQGSAPPSPSGSAPQSPIGSGDEQDDEKSSFNKNKANLQKKLQKEKNVKISKIAQRAFLFQDEEFMTLFAKLIANGIEDRGKETRDKSMKVLKKIESKHSDILKKYMDDLVMTKYEKWKRFNDKSKKKSDKKNKKKRKGNMRKAISRRGLIPSTPPSLNKNSIGSKSAPSFPKLPKDNDDNVNDNNGNVLLPPPN